MFFGEMLCDTSTGQLVKLATFVTSKDDYIADAAVPKRKREECPLFASSKVRGDSRDSTLDVTVLIFKFNKEEERMQF